MKRGHRRPRTRRLIPHVLKRILLNVLKVLLSPLVEILLILQLIQHVLLAVESAGFHPLGVNAAMDSSRVMVSQEKCARMV